MNHLDFYFTLKSIKFLEFHRICYDVNSGMNGNVKLTIKVNNHQPLQSSHLLIYLLFSYVTYCG